MNSEHPTVAYLETKLKGLVVFFTGASSGIGEELAYQLAGCGSRLILPARCVDELDRVKRHCLGPRIDILINNGGRSQHSLSLETSVDVYQVLMEHNFLGTVSFTKQVLPHMMQRGSCSVVTGFFNYLCPELTSQGYSSAQYVQGLYCHR
ncbi:dehydrogenase/reductase SDR family member 7-like [Salvelinus alpinus]